MGANDDFWDDVLGHIRQRVLLPVVGPDVTVVEAGNGSQPLTSLIGQRLTDRYDLALPPGPTTMGAAVAAFLRERGQDEVERLYRVINDILVDLDPAPGQTLRELASIDDLRIFVSTTPDRLLAQALNQVRFDGAPSTRELTFSPNQSTSEQSRNVHAPSSTDSVVLRLFGEAASTPQYAIHEEDRLEWIHALLSDAASLPDWLSHQLKHQPMLFLGCELPDWIGRFLLRMSSSGRLSLERKQFFFVGCSASHEPSLSQFFDTYCRKSQVQQLEMEPAEFVSELRTRWEKRGATRSGTKTTPTAASRGSDGSTPPESPTIFISYMREDVEAARRLSDAISDVGGDVWLDERRLSPGDAWEQELLAAIRRTVRLFVPIISASTEQVDEGYVFKEWAEAVERSRSIPRRRFIVPVMVDEHYAGDLSSYRQIPEAFRELHFGRAPAGIPDASMLSVLTTEIRAMRRSGAA